MSNNLRFMFKRKICKADEGVVGIVVAVLLIGLLATFISIIQMQYVPEWMKEKEAEHMDEVANQFSDLKFAIDTQTFYKEENRPITKSITLGSSELPFFVSVKSYGQLDVVDDVCTITISGLSAQDRDGNPISPTQTCSGLGIIKYSSNNAYLQEDPTFIYESGAIITSQNDGNFISIDPSFKPEISSTGSFEISFKIVDIQGAGGKTSEGGYGTTPIRTDFSPSQPAEPAGTIYDTNSITIQTEYTNSWGEFFKSSLKNIGLYEGTHFTVDVDDVLDQVTLTFIDTPTYGLPSVNFEKFVIEAQIGVGIVKV